MNQTLKRLFAALLIGVIGGTIFGFLSATRFTLFERFEAASYDLRMQMRTKFNPEAVSQWRGVVFVDIDDQSLTQMTFPVPRDMYKTVVEALHLAGAKAIGFDVLFSERTPGRVTREAWDDLHYKVYETFEKQLVPDEERETEIHEFIDGLRKFDIDKDFTDVASGMGAAYFPAAFNIDPEINRWSDYKTLQDELAASGVTERLRDVLFKHKEQFSVDWFSRTTNADRAFLLRRLVTKFGAPLNVTMRDIVNSSGDIKRMVLRELDELVTSRASRDFMTFLQTQLGSYLEYYASDAEKRDELDKLAMDFCRFNELELGHAAYNVFQDSIIYDRVVRAYEKMRVSDKGLKISTAAKRVFYDDLSENFPSYVFADSDPFDTEYRRAELRLRDYVMLTKCLDKRELAEKLPFSYEGVIPLTYYLEASPIPTYIQIKPDADGVVRKWPLIRAFKGFVPQFNGQLRVLPMMSFQLVLDYLGVPLDKIEVEPGVEIRIPAADGTIYRIPVDENCEANINWTGANFNDTFTHISFLEIYDQYKIYMEQLQEDPTAESKFIKEYLTPLVKGNLIFVGLTATGTHDYNPTPLNPRYPMVGAHGNFVSNVMTQQHIFRVGATTDFLITFAVVLCLCILMPFLSYSFSIIWFIFVTGAFNLLSYYLLINGVWINAFYVTAGAFIGGVMIFAAKYLLESASRAKLKKIFSVYLSPKLVDQMADKLEDVKLGGQKMVATVYFSDIAGFTAISEGLNPVQLVEILNKYLSLMTDNILGYEGLLDKYIGDAVVAAFGVPFELEDHAVRACRAALKNMRSLEELNRELAGSGAPALHQRIGLNSGELVAGNMGSEQRLSYTVMGDTVNLGSRLENANKYYGTSIMISETTYEMVKTEFVCRKLDILKVVGKDMPVAVYELVGENGGVEAVKIEACKKFGEGMAHYAMREFDLAKSCFSSTDEMVGGDPPSKVFIKRCDLLNANPPDEDWDGVWELTSK